MSNKLVELRCNKDLISSNFDGYKLSLNEIPVFNYKLPSDVRQLRHAGDNFSYLYLALFTMHNHIIVDPWDKNSIYYIDENQKLFRLVLNSQLNNVDRTDEMVQIVANNDKNFPYNATNIFASEKISVVSDGSGFLHVYNTGRRSEFEKWTLEFSSEILGDKYPFTILDARCTNNNESPHLHCLLTAIHEDKTEETSTIYRACTELFWVVLKRNNASWEVTDTCKMKTRGAVKYGYFGAECNFLFVESTKPLQLPTENKENGVSKESPKEPSYFWQQSLDDINIWFPLSKSCSKGDIKINVTEKRVDIVLRNETTLLSGDTFQRLDPELTTWNIVDNRLEITLSKHEEGAMWQYLVRDDNRGEEIMDDTLVNEIHERLAHLTSANEVTIDDTIPAFNPGQLEACDRVVDEDSRLYVVAGSTKTITKTVNLSSHQKLFNVRVDSGETPYLCIRHDVDGILWKVSDTDEEVCRHVATINAFGYILASKQWKYCTCSPDFSYAVIASAKQNLFVYKQNCSVESELRNRKTGDSFSQVGKQYLITLSSADEILGIHATNEYLFVLSKSYVHVYLMKHMS